MKYFKWFLFSLASLLIDLVSRPLLNWIVVLFADDNGNLPRWCRYWQTFDATCYQGQLAREADIRSGSTSDMWRTFIGFPLTAWHRYLNRKNWLQRNCCYGWSFFVFGQPWKKEDWTVHKFVSTPTSELFFATSPTMFDFHYIGPWGSYKFGWKARNFFNATTQQFDKDTWGNLPGLDRVPHVISLNPFKRKK